MALTAEQRVLRAKQAAHKSWANTSDVAARVKPANDARFEKYRRQVVAEAAERGESLTDPAEIDRRAKHAEKAEMTRLAFLSSKARSQRAKAGE